MLGGRARGEPSPWAGGALLLFTRQAAGVTFPFDPIELAAPVRGLSGLLDMGDATIDIVEGCGAETPDHAEAYRVGAAA